MLCSWADSQRRVRTMSPLTPVTCDLTRRAPSPPAASFFRVPVASPARPAGGTLGGNHLDIHIHAILTPVRYISAPHVAFECTTEICFVTGHIPKMKALDRMPREVLTTTRPLHRIPVTKTSKVTHTLKTTMTTTASQPMKSKTPPRQCLIT